MIYDLCMCLCDDRRKNAGRRSMTCFVRGCQDRQVERVTQIYKHHNVAPSTTVGSVNTLHRGRLALFQKCIVRTQVGSIGNDALLAFLETNCRYRSHCALSGGAERAPAKTNPLRMNKETNSLHPHASRHSRFRTTKLLRRRTHDVHTQGLPHGMRLAYNKRDTNLCTVPFDVK